MSRYEVAVDVVGVVGVDRCKRPTMQCIRAELAILVTVSVQSSRLTRDGVVAQAPRRLPHTRRAGDFRGERLGAADTVHASLKVREWLRL